MIKIYIEEEIIGYRINYKDIKDIESIIQCILPQDYKEFLLKHNGGSPNFDAFEIKNYFPNGSSSFTDIRYFFGLCHDKKSVMKCYDIFDNIRCYEGRVPNELLPIATDSLGNLICLGIKEKYYGKIYFWHHEEESDREEKPWWKNITLIADSFTDFLSTLSKYELDDNDRTILTYQDGTVRIVD